MSYLPRNLKYLRQLHNIRQPDLAAKLGYKSFTTVQKWEDGTSEPRLSTMKTLSDLFDVPMESLYNVDLSNPRRENDTCLEMLLSYYNHLSVYGQKMVLDYAELLVNSGKYPVGSDINEAIDCTPCEDNPDIKEKPNLR